MYKRTHRVCFFMRRWACIVSCICYKVSFSCWNSKIYTSSKYKRLIQAQHCAAAAQQAGVSRINFLVVSAIYRFVFN